MQEGRRREGGADQGEGFQASADFFGRHAGQVKILLRSFLSFVIFPHPTNSCRKSFLFNIPIPGALSHLHSRYHVHARSCSLNVSKLNLKISKLHRKSRIRSFTVFGQVWRYVGLGAHSEGQIISERGLKQCASKAPFGSEG